MPANQRKKAKARRTASASSAPVAAACADEVNVASQDQVPVPALVVEKGTRELPRDADKEEEQSAAGEKKRTRELSQAGAWDAFKSVATVQTSPAASTDPVPAPTTGSGAVTQGICAPDEATDDPVPAPTTGSGAVTQGICAPDEAADAMPPNPSDMETQNARIRQLQAEVAGLIAVREADVRVAVAASSDNGASQTIPRIRACCSQCVISPRCRSSYTRK